MSTHNKEAPATEQAPSLPEPAIVSYQTDSTMRTMELRTYCESQVREYAEQYAAWKIAALRSAQAPAGEVPQKELDALLDHIYEHGTAAEGVKERALKFARAYVALSTPPAVPQGWKLVPVEPTREMVEAGMKEVDWYAHNARECYCAMLSAAPAAPQTKEAK